MNELFDSENQDKSDGCDLGWFKLKKNDFEIQMRFGAKKKIRAKKGTKANKDAELTKG